MSRFRRRFFISICALFAGAVVSIAGCDRDTSSPPLAPPPATHAPPGIDPPDEKPPRVTTWASDEGRAIIRRVAGCDDVEAIVEAAAPEYRLAVEDAVVVTGTARAREAVITYLPLPSVRAPYDECMVIVNLEWESERMATAMILSSQPSPGAIGSFGELYVSRPNAPEAIDTGRWSQEDRDTFLNCVVEHAATAGLYCAVVCTWSFGAWAQCMVTCVTARGVATMVGCLTQVLLLHKQRAREIEDRAR